MMIMRTHWKFLCFLKKKKKNLFALGKTISEIPRQTPSEIPNSHQFVLDTLQSHHHSPSPTVKKRKLDKSVNDGQNFLV